MKVSTGLAIGKSAKPELASQAVAAAMAKANIHTPSSVLLFLTSEFAANPQSAIKAAAKTASCTQIIGCSASGIFTEEDWVLDSAAAAAMVFSDDFKLAVTGEHCITDTILTIAAPNAINSTWLNMPISGRAVARFGGVSGDATGHGPFSVWQNGKGATQGFCELVIQNAKAAIGASHGLKMISKPQKITKTNGHDMCSIANIHALLSLFSAWQKHSKSPIPFHQLVAVYSSKATQIERGDYNIASIISGNEKDHSVTLTKTLKEGEWLCWALRDIDAAQIDIVKTASELKQQLSVEPAFALMFSCLGRGPYFYDGTDQDLALLKALFPKLPMIGFYGNGEIAPMHGVNELLQYSAVLGLFAHSPLI
ncbi:MAG: FIST C-terminal domain-containing protein [Methylophilaceae bacterium]